jgi:DNA modification methylase
MSKRVKIADLKFDPENARVRTAKGEAMIQESLRQVGAARSIVIDEDGIILAGNGTVEAAGQIGIDNVVIVEASGDEIIAVRRKGLTDEQKKKLAYYDNRTGDEAEWDMEQVARDLLGGYDFLDELFDDIQVPEPEKEGTDELPEDPAEVLREKWGVEYGDLWQMGPHRILCGDSTKKEDVDRLLDGATPNLMVTDPPFCIGSRTGQAMPVLRALLRLRTIWAEAWKLFSGNVAYVWHADRFSKTVCQSLEDVGFEPTYLLIWNKNRAPIGRGHYHHKHEPCWFVKRKRATADWIGGRKQNTVWDIDLPSRGNDTSHGTQKPLECMAQPIRNHKGDVYDPFVGSGTTLVAAHNEGRTCYAMEIDPAYVAVCIERMAQLGYDPDKVEKLES